MHVDFEQDSYKKENVSRYANIYPKGVPEGDSDPFENHMEQVLNSVHNSHVDSHSSKKPSSDEAIRTFNSFIWNDNQSKTAE